MYKKLFTVSLVVSFLISLTNLSHAQKSIGKVEEDIKVAGANIIDIPVKQWMGKRFIFAEQPKSFQKFGYHLWLHPEMYLHNGKPNVGLETQSHLLRYDKFVGKVIKVVHIEKEKHGAEFKVTFVEEKSNIKIYATTHKGYIGDIAPLVDLMDAKKKWMGKTIYSKVRKILTYNEKLDKYGEVKVKIGEPLKVIDIYRGFAWENTYLWIVVKTDDRKEGFIKTRFSWTNCYTDEWSDKRPWEDDFFEFNPREKYAWSEEIWKLINSSKIRIGMNQEQVRLSWGKPEKINKDIYESSIHEQWIYGDQYIYFEDGKLTYLQNF